MALFKKHELGMFAAHQPRQISLDLNGSQPRETPRCLGRGSLGRAKLPASRDLSDQTWMCLVSFRHCSFRQPLSQIFCGSQFQTSNLNSCFMHLSSFLNLTVGPQLDHFMLFHVLLEIHQHLQLDHSYKYITSLLREAKRFEEHSDGTTTPGSTYPCNYSVVLVFSSFHDETHPLDGVTSETAHFSNTRIIQVIGYNLHINILNRPGIRNLCLGAMPLLTREVLK